MLFIRFSDFIHPVTEGLYPFTNYPNSSSPSRSRPQAATFLHEVFSTCFSLDGPCHSLNFQSSYLYHSLGYLGKCLFVIRDQAVHDVLILSESL